MGMLRPVQALLKLDYFRKGSLGERKKCNQAITTEILMARTYKQDPIRHKGSSP